MRSELYHSFRIYLITSRFLIIILYPVYFYPLYPKTLLHIPVCTENQKGIFTA